jgi:cell division protein FtsW
MAKRVGVDKLLFCVTLILVVIGLAMVFSASAVMAKERFSSPYYFVTRQAIYAVAGLAAMTLLMQIDYRKYNRPNVVSCRRRHRHHAAGGLPHARLA